jgi:hypothetical protein
MSTKLAMFLGTLPLALAPAQSGRAEFPEVCPNLIPHEPVLVYEITGGTLLGPVDRTLVVYGDGTTRLTDLSDPARPRARRCIADPEAVESLALRLERYGAMLECDAPGLVMDAPLHTLTLLVGGTEARARTFSWWVPEGASGAIEHQLDAFVAETFPRF